MNTSANFDNSGSDMQLLGDGVCTEMTVNLGSPATPSYTDGNITFNSGADKCVSVMPSTADGVDADLTVNFAGNGKVGSVTIKNGIKAGRIYAAVIDGHATAITVPAAEPAPVEGDDWINFNDPAMGVTGLPIWSKKNLGATCSTANPTDPKTATTWYGNYYAWGEVAPYATTINWTSATSGSVTTWCAHPSHNSGITFDKSVGYQWKNYLDGTHTSWSTTYEWSPTPYDGTTKVLTTAYDAAYQNATPANTWRMPKGGASGEWKQLKDNTYFQWTTSYNDISGLKGYIVYKVKGSAHKGYWTYYSSSTWKTKDSSGTVVNEYEGQQNPFGYTATDPHMFLPAAGYFFGTSLYDAGSYGYYWSSSLYSSYPYYAYLMYFYSGNVYPQFSSSRYYGFTVRPVQ